MEWKEWLTSLPGDWSIPVLFAKGGGALGVGKFAWRRWRTPGQPGLVTRLWYAAGRAWDREMVIADLRRDLYDRDLRLVARDKTLSLYQDEYARRFGIELEVDSSARDERTLRRSSRTIRSSPKRINTYRPAPSINSSLSLGDGDD